MAKLFYWVSWTERHDAVVEVSPDEDSPQERARELALNEIPPMGERMFEFESEIDGVNVSPITNSAVREFADFIAR